jgi:anti-anti-sigma factor
MDCSGLGLLAGAASAASKHGGCVRLTGASQLVRKLVTLTNLDPAVSMFDSVDDARTVPAAPGTNPAP